MVKYWTTRTSNVGETMVNYRVPYSFYFQVHSTLILLHKYSIRYSYIIILMSSAEYVFCARTRNSLITKLATKYKYLHSFINAF